MSYGLEFGSTFCNLDCNQNNFIQRSSRKLQRIPIIMNVFYPSFGWVVSSFPRRLKASLASLLNWQKLANSWQLMCTRRSVEGGGEYTATFSANLAGSLLKRCHCRSFTWRDHCLSATTAGLFRNRFINNRNLNSDCRGSIWKFKSLVH